MHPLLKRQLKRFGSSDPTVPLTPEAWPGFLERISNAYTEADQGRELLERSLAISSKEMTQLYEDLRHTSEMRLRNEQERTKMIVDHALDAIISVDAAGIIIDWNPQAETLFGWEKEEVVGHLLSEKIIPPDFREAHNHGFKEFLRTGKGTMVNQRLEVSALNRHGDIFPIEICVNPFTVDGNTIFSAFIRDITQRKEAERALHHAKEAAEHAAKAKSEFLATMSHEIRTPMNGIIGMTGLLLDTDLKAEQFQFAETVRSSGEALLTIINDILDFSKIEAGKLDVETVDFDLRVSMEDSLDLLAEKAGSKNLELIGCVDARVPTALRGDPGRFRQVLLNLVGNAVKFTPSGEVIIRITLQEETAEKALINVTVQDSGIGIDPDVQQKLFQPFQQADGSTTRQFGGTGLGLAICKQLVELMGGTIGVDSQKGQGSTFWFTSEFLKQPIQSRIILSPKPLHGLRMCCVDNHPVNRHLLEEYAKDWGVRCTSASTPAEALHLLHTAFQQHDPFDIAVLDRTMPGMDGLTLAQTIKNDSQLSAIRLVLLSSLGQRGDAGEAKAAGFSGYLTKPIRQNVLKHTLETVMGLLPETLKDPEAPVITRFATLESSEKRRKRVLIVDDHQVNQQLAVMMIERLGHKADVAANGQEAVEACLKIPYDLVLMDCHMPIMDGYEATRTIRKTERDKSEVKSQELGVNGEAKETELSQTSHSLLCAPHCFHLPIIAMTANAMPEDRDKCLQAGMDDYLPKPIRADDLAQALQRWLPTRAR